MSFKRNLYLTSILALVSPEAYAQTVNGIYVNLDLNPAGYGSTQAVTIYCPTSLTSITATLCNFGSGGGGSATNPNASSTVPTYTAGTNPFSMDLSGALRTKPTIGGVDLTTWPISGTISVSGTPTVTISNSPTVSQGNAGSVAQAWDTVLSYGGSLVSGTNKFPVTDSTLDSILGTNTSVPVNITGGSVTANNSSVGVTATTAPTSATELGYVSSGGSLLAVSPTNGFPVVVESGVSLPLPTGAATSALQSSQVSSLTTLITNLGSPVQAGSTLSIAGSLGITSIGGTNISGGSLPVTVSNSPTVSVSGTPSVLLSSGSSLSLNGTISSSASYAGATGSAIPSYADFMGFSNSSGSLVGVSASNPLPITGSITANNSSVGATATTAPTSATELGYVSSGGSLLAVSSTNGLPVSVGNTITIAGSVASSLTAIAPINSSALESQHLLKSSAGTLYSYTLSNTGSVAGWVVVSNIGSTLTAGAITPVECLPISAGGFVNHTENPPLSLSSGIVVAFTTSSCFTLATSSVAFITGQIQ